MPVAVLGVVPAPPNEKAGVEDVDAAPGVPNSGFDGVVVALCELSAVSLGHILCVPNENVGLLPDASRVSMSTWHLLLSDEPKENEAGAPPPKAVLC